MSEYQYYEFRAIDRPLNDRQMQELRATSTRAVISRTSFRNHYEYGDLKANPRDLLVKYFDASLYFANWLSLEVAFRYPKGVVDVKALRRYAAGHTVDIRSTGSDVVVALTVESDGDSFDTTDDGSGWLSSLAGLRADIATGDERALYLAWLLDVQCGVIADSAIEPGRPEGLGKLSPALASFVDIFGLDRDLVAVAAAGDSSATADPSPRDIERWLASLGPNEHVALLARVARAGWERERRNHTALSAVRSTTTIRSAVADGWRFAGARRDDGGGEAPGCPAEGSSGSRTARTPGTDRPRSIPGQPRQARTPSLAASRRTHWHEAAARLRRCGDAPRRSSRCERTEKARRPVRAAHQRAA